MKFLTKKNAAFCCAIVFIICQKTYSQEGKVTVDQDVKFEQLLNEKRKIKIICSCGCELRKSDFRRHEKSQKHISLMKEKQEI